MKLVYYEAPPDKLYEKLDGSFRTKKVALKNDEDIKKKYKLVKNQEEK